jgi:hypothetical protein
LRSGPLFLQTFISQALIWLLDFADSHRNLGLRVSPTDRMKLPRVAVVHVTGPASLDFHVVLPTANGDLAFVANW